MAEATAQLLQSCLAILWASTGAVLTTTRTRRSERDLAHGMLGLGLLVGAVATAFDTMTVMGGMPLGAWALLACVGLRAVAAGHLSPASGRGLLPPLATCAGLWLLLHWAHHAAPLQPVATWPWSLRPVDLATGAALWFAATRTRWGMSGGDDEREVRRLLIGTGLSLIAASVAGPYADRVAAGGALLASLPLWSGVLVDHLQQASVAIASSFAAVLTLALRAHVGASGLDLHFAGIDDPLAAIAGMFVLFGLALQAGRQAAPAPAVPPVKDITPTVPPAIGTEAAAEPPATANDPSWLTTRAVMRNLRDPVTSMLAASRLVADHGARGSQHMLHDMQEFGRQLAAAMTDVDDLEHLLRGDFDLATDVYDLPQLLRACLDEVEQAHAEHAVELRQATPEPLPRWIQGDPARVRQLVTRVLRLAIAQNTIGPIGVTCRVHDERLLLEVNNNTHKGSDPQSLGLLFALKLAEVLGGSLTTAVDGDGCCYRLQLPAAPAPDWEIELLAQDEASSQNSADTPQPPRLAGKVLLVADRLDHQRLIGALLSKAGADVNVADASEVALQLLAELHFELVLLDMDLPGADAAVAALRARGDTTPVLALVGDDSPAALERCLAAGCNDALRKPVQAERLLQAIALHLAVAT